MLFTFGLFLLLTPLPSFQSPPSDRRDTIASEGPKANAVLTLLKPKTTVAPAKGAVRSAPKPSTVIQTLLFSPTTTPNPPTTSASGTTKSRQKPPVIQTSPAAAIKAAPASSGANKDKHTAAVNQTSSGKPRASAEAKASKDKLAPTAAPNVQQTTAKTASSVKNTKDKTSVTQNVSVKFLSSSDANSATEKPSKNRPQSSVNQATTSGAKGAKDKFASTRPSPAQIALAKQTKEKVQPAVIVTTKSPSINVTVAKDKGATTTAQGVQITSTRSPSINVTVAKDKGTTTTAQSVQITSTRSPSINVTVAKDKGATTTAQGVQITSTRSPSINVTVAKDKGTTTTAQGVQITSTKSPSSSGSKTLKEKPVSAVNSTATAKSPSASGEMSFKDKAASTATTPTKAPITVKGKTLPSANQTMVIASKPSAAPTPPIKVVISDGCESSSKKKKELELKPGAPLVMTHKISLVPTSCKGGCEAKMAVLEGRVALLEKEMSSLKEKCACSVSCPNDCSGNGKCESGKCTCHQGFMGPDCNKVVKDKPKATVETGITSNKRDISQTKPKKNSEGKEVDSKTKDGSNKTQTKPETTEKTANVTKTFGQKLFNKEKTQEVRTDKPLILTPKKKHTDPKVGDSADKTISKSDQPKDEPHTNVTQTVTKLIKGATKYVNETRKTGPQQSTITDKSTQQGQKTKGDDKHTEDNITAKTNEGQKSRYIVNVTTLQSLEETGPRSGGLGLVRIMNVSSYSFILTWSAPHGMFKNFTVIRHEPGTEEQEEEQVLEKDKTLSVKNMTETQVQSEITVNASSSSTKLATTRGKTESRRISMVVPGNTRSVQFSNLRANTQYVLYIHGSRADRISKTHQVTATTGPEPLKEVAFSDVTETSFALSWNKPKGAFSGYRISYINIVTGESHFVTVAAEHTTFVLSKLSPSTSYIVTVTTTQGRAQSDPHTSLITTVPAPPTNLRAVDVSDTRALLKWTASLGKVDRFVITYESSKTPNVTVTVMLSGNTVEHQLKALQRGTLYTVKVLSQKVSYQSPSVSTTFTTANAVKASEVGARHAVITWKQSAYFQSYRIIYQVVGEESKEIILDPTVTEYKLTGLLPMSRYMVLVQGEKDGYYTSLVTTGFTTGKLRFPYPTECSQELLNGALQSGEVDIYPRGREGQAVRVYCDMETDGGGWTVFQRRMNGKTDFYRTWNEYSTGFGNISEEFWLGNRLLHNLTSVGPVSLRVDMRSGNDSAYAHYANFSIDSEERHYALTIFGYTGTAGDSMRYHNGRPFSTRDKDPDALGIHCSRAYMGGWWYKNCYKTNLNGLYGFNSNNQGIVWIDWKGKDSSIPFTEMKFRPSTFSPATHG